MTTISPDLRAYTDLTLYDRDPYTMTQAALAAVSTNFPGYVPAEGDIGTALIEAESLIAAENVYALNRIPGAIMEILLQLFNIFRDEGAAPTASATITVTVSTGVTIPAGTKVALPLSGNLSPVVFTTDTALIIAGGHTTGTVNVTGATNTDQANGVAIGTALNVLNQQVYIQSVALASSPFGGRLPESAQAWIDRGTGSLGRLTNALALAPQFTSYALTQPGIFRAFTVDNYEPSTNLLTAQQASLEDGTTTGWAASNVNTTIGNLLTASALNGSHVLTLTSAASGLCGANTPTGTSGVPVVPGLQYTGLASFMAAASGGSHACEAQLNWYQTDGSPSVVRASDTGSSVTDTTSAWVQASVTANAPSDAAFANVEPIVVSAAAGSEVHWADKISIAQNASTTWTAPATATNVGGYMTVAVFGQSGVYVPTATKVALQTAMAALAQANLIVSVIDPTVTAVNVTTTVKAKAGYDAGTVSTNVQAAVAVFLSTDSWPWSSTVYVNSLIAAISDAAGVDHVVSVASPASDVVLSGVAPLAKAGTVTVTVT